MLLQLEEPGARKKKGPARRPTLFLNGSRKLLLQSDRGDLVARGQVVGVRRVVPCLVEQSTPVARRGGISRSVKFDLNRVVGRPHGDLRSGNVRGNRNGLGAKR